MVHIIPCRSAECIDLDCFQHLPCVRYFYIPSVCLEGCWMSLLSSIAVILYYWLASCSDIFLLLFLYRVKNIKNNNKPHKQQYAINNNNYYNYNCNKKAMDHKCWCSVSGQSVWYEWTDSGVKSKFKSPPRQHAYMQVCICVYTCTSSVHDFRGHLR